MTACSGRVGGVQQGTVRAALAAYNQVGVNCGKAYHQSEKPNNFPSQLHQIKSSSSSSLVALLSSSCKGGQRSFWIPSRVVIQTPSTFGTLLDLCMGRLGTSRHSGTRTNTSKSPSSTDLTY